YDVCSCARALRALQVRLSIAQGQQGGGYDKSSRRLRHIGRNHTLVCARCDVGSVEHDAQVSALPL
ncbi:MAG TPA: hypothetical protein VIK79_13890, partial [Xanthobacteraceae bacterium]